MSYLDRKFEWRTGESPMAALLNTKPLADIDFAMGGDATRERMEAKRRRDEREAEKRARKERSLALIAALNATDDPATVAMVALHERYDEYGPVQCLGCDQGCSCDRADWPCSTIVALAEIHGIDTP